MDPVISFDHVVEIALAITMLAIANFMTIRGALNGLKATIKSTNSGVYDIKGEMSKMRDVIDDLDNSVTECKIDMGRLGEKVAHHELRIGRNEKNLDRLGK